MADMRSLLAGAVGADHVLAAGDVPPDYGHDESLTVAAGAPAFVVRPGSTAEVAAVLRVAGAHGLAGDRARLGHRAVRRRGPAPAAGWWCRSSG